MTEPTIGEEGIERERMTARAVIDTAICEHYPELVDPDFPENFGAIVEEALAHHDYAIVSTASVVRHEAATRTIRELREKYKPGLA